MAATAGRRRSSLSVGRAVSKKGYGDLLTALAALPTGLAWRFVHIGGGPLLPELKALAEQLGLSDRIEWRGAQPQEKVLDALPAGGSVRAGQPDRR